MEFNIKYVLYKCICICMLCNIKYAFQISEINLLENNIKAKNFISILIILIEDKELNLQTVRFNQDKK